MGIRGSAKRLDITLMFIHVHVLFTKCRSSGNNPFIAKEVRGSKIFHEIQKYYLS